MRVPLEALDTANVPEGSTVPLAGATGSIMPATAPPAIPPGSLPGSDVELLGVNGISVSWSRPLIGRFKEPLLELDCLLPTPAGVLLEAFGEAERLWFLLRRRDGAILSTEVGARITGGSGVEAISDGGAVLALCGNSVGLLLIKRTAITRALDNVAIGTTHFQFLNQGTEVDAGILSVVVSTDMSWS